MDRLFLCTLLLAEITRYKAKGKGGIKMSLTHPAMEKGARMRFAAAFGGGLTHKSKPDLFIAALGVVHKDNNMFDKFSETLRRFELNAEDFHVDTVDTIAVNPEQAN